MKVPEQIIVSLNKHIGRAVVRVRRKRSMSQGDLARALGIARKNMWNYEHGETRWTVDILLVVSAALGCHYRDLIDGYIPPRMQARIGTSSTEDQAGRVIDAGNPEDFLPI